MSPVRRTTLALAASALFALGALSGCSAEDIGERVAEEAIENELGESADIDIDSDGESEQISRLVSGSGFLTLDKNGDGAVNDGSELFGPTLGNGFEELKAYDSDGNDWIDENDDVYDKLRIWMDDGQGNMQLIALGQAGVGALYLGNVASAFDIKDAANNSLGTVQSTGVFLGENGGVGTIQHIDLTI